MDFTQFAISNLIGIIGFALVVAGVMKVFQIAASLNEIKELLADIKRNTVDHSPSPVPTSPPPPFMYSQSGDEMLRALGTDQEPAVPTGIVQSR